MIGEPSSLFLHSHQSWHTLSRVDFEYSTRYSQSYCATCKEMIRQMVSDIKVINSLPRLIDKSVTPCERVKRTISDKRGALESCPLGRPDDRFSLVV